jgi:hypothetical protein
MHREGLDLTAAAGLHAILAYNVAQGDGAGAARALNGIIAVVEQLVTELDSLT